MLIDRTITVTIMMTNEQIATRHTTRCELFLGSRVLIHTYINLVSCRFLNYIYTSLYDTDEDEMRKAEEMSEFLPVLRQGLGGDISETEEDKSVNIGIFKRQMTTKC